MKLATSFYQLKAHTGAMAGRKRQASPCSEMADEYGRVNALIACFGKSYDEAYGSAQCRQLAEKVASSKVD